MKTSLMANSTAMTRYTYDDEKKVLTVTMAYNPPKSHGEVLKYKGVPKDIFEAMMASESKGRFFNQHIRESYELIK